MLDKKKRQRSDRDLCITNQIKIERKKKKKENARKGEEGVKMKRIKERKKE